MNGLPGIEERLASLKARIGAIESRFATEAGRPQQAGGFSAALDAATARATAPRPEINALIQQEAQAQGLDPSLVQAVVQAESGFDPNAVSPVGAQGLMQLMPKTAASLGVEDSFNPAQNIHGGTQYLKQLIDKYQSVPTAVAAYNAGPGAVDKFGGQIPPYAETQAYVKRVMGLQSRYQQQPGGF